MAMQVNWLFQVELRWKGNSKKQTEKEPAKNYSHFSNMKQDEIVETLLKETAGQEKLTLTDEREDEVIVFPQNQS